MSWKKKDIDNTPIEFNTTLKTVELLTKNRAHQFIAFQNEEGRDKYFIDMNFVSKKHLTISDSHFIVEKDMASWIRYMKTKGWESCKDIKSFMEALKPKINNENGDEE